MTRIAKLCDGKKFLQVVLKRRACQHDAALCFDAGSQQFPRLSRCILQTMTFVTDEQVEIGRLPWRENKIANENEYSTCGASAHLRRAAHSPSSWATLSLFREVGKGRLLMEYCGDVW